MADKKISALTAATTPLAGTEVLPIVQGGSTVKVSISDVTAGRAMSSLSGSFGTGTPAYSIGGTQVGITNTSANAYLSIYGGVGSTNGGFLLGGNNAENFANLFWSNGSNFMQIATTPVSSKVQFNIAGVVVGDITTNGFAPTAGKGIDFSANGGDVLSQYDEGTYTPVFTASSSNPTVTYGLQRGKYVRVGNTVTVSVFITWSALSGGSGDLQISLPFAGESSVGAGAAGAIADLTGFTFAAGRTFCSVRPNANVLYATFPQSGSAVSTSNTTVAQTASSGLIVFSTTYLI